MGYANITSGGQLESTAAAAWNRLEEAYKEAFGSYLPVTSALRTRAEQTRLYNGWIQRLPGFYLAARPGTSLHEKGLSVDVGSPANRAGTAQHNWVVANGGQFGFTWTGKNFSPRENWHFDYTGGGNVGSPAFSQDVANRQTFLNGAIGAGLVVDGDLGPKTRAAIAIYQREVLHITGDGDWGPITTTAHNAHVAASQAAAAQAAAQAAATAAKPRSSSAVLRRGSKGAAVKQLQDVLNAHYPLYSRLVPDADYGPATEAVVLELQTRAGLGRDGIAGAETLGYLGL